LGTLYLCGVPIGNHQDATFRLIETLKNVNLIACEDKRVTGLLLETFQIKNTLINYHIHNEKESTAEIIEKLKSGLSVALVTDAGMPSISDPGFYLAREALNELIPVVVIPGVSAVTTAITVSGMACDEFAFYGFVSKKNKAEFFQEKLNGPTAIYFESPERLLDTLQVLKDLELKQFIFVGRELTKTHEETFRGTVSDALIHFEAKKAIKGELVLIIEKNQKPTEALLPEKILSLAKNLVAKGLKKSEVAGMLAESLEINKNELYSKLVSKD
jgi:16S rRNA (cytidine1402-2'-O)-methyltransferase